MIIKFFMKPGIRMKRWLFLGFIGVCCTCIRGC